MLAQMQHRFKPGDFLFFQLEAGFALIRLIEIELKGDETVWHVTAYNDLFPDVETIERAIAEPSSLSVSIPHVALTDRAFQSTQVSDIGNASVTQGELTTLNSWRDDPQHTISDRSIRLLTGLR